MSQARKHRGRATERLVAAYWRANGWPWCEPNGASAAGADLTGTPGLAVEIKARANVALPAFMRQAQKHAGAHLLPVLILRLNGQGPKTVGDWPVILRHSDFLQLLDDAGYTSKENRS